MKFSNSIILAALIGTSVFSCTPRKFNNSSRLYHKADSYVRTTSGWMWAEVSRDEFIRDVMGTPLDSEKAKLYFPADHPTSKRAEFWVQQIDKVLRGLYPDQMREVPVPHAIIMTEPEPNAFVTSAHNCFENPVYVNGMNLSGTSNSWINFGDPGRYSMVERQKLRCIPNPHKNRLSEVTAWLSEKQDGNCRVHEEQGKIVFDDCKEVKNTFSDTKIPQGFALTVAANWVVLHSGMVSDDKLVEPFDKVTGEERLVAVIAHELSHYYRSHLTLSRGDYFYWYQSPKIPKPDKPTPLEKGSELEKLALDIFNGRSSVDGKVEGQKLTPRTFTLLQSLINTSLASRQIYIDQEPEIKALLGNSIPTTCWQAMSYIYPSRNSPNVHEFILRFPQIRPQTADEKAIFITAESLMLQCANELQIGFIKNNDDTPIERDGKQMTNGQAFPYLRIDRFLGRWANAGRSAADAEVARSKQTMGNVLKNLNRVDLPVVNEELSRAFKEQANDLLLTEAAEGHFLGEFISSWQDKMSSVSQEYKDKVEKARAAGISIYSFETEADELAVETMAKVGLDPIAALAHHYSLTLMSEKYRGHDPVLGNSPAECLAMYKSDWAKTPFIGTVTDIHLGPCFRMFNAWREIQAHGFTKGARPVPTDGQSWENIVKSARDYESRF